MKGPGEGGGEMDWGGLGGVSVGGWFWGVCSGRGHRAACPHPQAVSLEERGRWLRLLSAAGGADADPDPDPDPDPDHAYEDPSLATGAWNGAGNGPVRSGSTTTAVPPLLQPQCCCSYTTAAPPLQHSTTAAAPL